MSMCTGLFLFSKKYKEFKILIVNLLIKGNGELKGIDICKGENFIFLVFLLWLPE